MNRRRLRYTLIIILIGFSAPLQAQRYRVDDAIKFYGDQKYEEAKEQLDLAKKHPRSVLFPETWAYDFLIAHKKYESAESLADSIAWIKYMANSYLRGFPLDTSTVYFDSLKIKLSKISLGFKQMASDDYLDNDVKSFLKWEDTYLTCGLALEDDIETRIFQFAEYAKSVNRNNLALKYYEQSILKDYESLISYANLISLNRLENRETKADSILNSALTVFDGIAVEKFVDAMSSYDQGHFFTALKLINEALVVNPNQPSHSYLLGLINLKTERIEVAIDAFHKVEEIIGTPYLSYYQLGKYYLMDGEVNDDDEAITIAKFYLEQCEKMQPNDLYMLAELLKLYQELDDEVNTKRILDKLNS